MGQTQSIEMPIATARPISHVDEVDISIPIAEPVINIVVKSEPLSEDDWGYMNIGYGMDARREVHDMYITVKKLKLEEWMKKYDSSRDRYSENYDLISINLENNNHSGASFSGCMWAVSKVFRDGWYQGYSNRESMCPMTSSKDVV